MDFPRFEAAGGHVLPLSPLPSPNTMGLALWLAGPAQSRELPDHLWNALSSSEKDRANRFVRAGDRALFVLTRGALRYLLSAATGASVHEIAFAEGAYGKPYLAGGSGPHFSVSHSGSFALIGLSARRPVGVDIELIRVTGDELDLARSFFSDAECRALEALDERTLCLSFYKTWTAKEAVLKACGLGISEHFKDFSIELAEAGYAIHAQHNCPLPGFGSFAIGPVEVPEGYVGCYALA